MPSTVIVVVVVVTVRWLSRAWSPAAVCRLASNAALPSSTLVLLFIGVLTAEKLRFSLGVPAWLREKDMALELDCSFLLRRVLAERTREHKCGVLWYVVKK